ncbi:MAG: type II toxin-antitoxin system RelE/ParE family toxin [Phycisphaerae bacterium]
MKPAIYHPAAEQELNEAALFYESRSSGLGAVFMSEVEESVRRIQEGPETFPVLRGKVRRKLVYNFPYGILYREDATEIRIVAVMHLHRRPGYWQSRV